MTSNSATSAKPTCPAPTSPRSRSSPAPTWPAKARSSARRR
jgi:hypothetical protein